MGKASDNFIESSGADIVFKDVCLIVQPQTPSVEKCGHVQGVSP